MELRTYNDVCNQSNTQLVVDWSSGDYKLFKMTKGVNLKGYRFSFIKPVIIDVPEMYKKRSKFLTPRAVCNIILRQNELFISVKGNSEIAKNIYDWVKKLDSFHNVFEYPFTLDFASIMSKYNALPCYQAMYMIPSPNKINIIEPPSNKFSITKLNNSDLEDLLIYVDEYSNALDIDLNKTVSAYGVYEKTYKKTTRKPRPVAICTATKESLYTALIGLDTLKDYRGKGLQKYLLPRVTRECLEMELAPLYSVAWSNVSSQNVAYKCGYKIGWVEMTAVEKDFVERVRNQGALM